MKANVSMLWHPNFPRLNNCVVTKQMFYIVLLRLFSIKFRCFVSTVGFSNEDNCCQLQRIEKLIKEKLFKGIFKVVQLIDVAGNTDFIKFIANIWEQNKWQTFLRVKRFLVFFPNHA